MRGYIRHKDTQTRRYTDTLTHTTHRHTEETEDTQRPKTHIHTDTQTHRHTRHTRHTDPHRHTDTQTQKTQMTAKMPKHTHTLRHTRARHTESIGFSQKLAAVTHDVFFCVGLNTECLHMNESCHTYEWVMSHTWMSLAYIQINYFYIWRLQQKNKNSTKICGKNEDNTIWASHVYTWMSRAYI